MQLVHHHELAHVTHEPPSRKRWYGLIFICIAVFISAIDMTIINVALGAISNDMHASITQLQWVVDGFMIALGGLILVGNGLGDRFGRRLVFIIGLAGFALSSLLAALCNNPNQLIASRVLMGASAALFLPTALSLIAVTFPPEIRQKAIAAWAAIGGLGIALGPTIGGYLVQDFGWQWIFAVNIPVALIAVVGSCLTLPESRKPGEPSIDIVGAILSIIALTGIVFFVIEGSNGWTAPAVLVALAVGIVGLLAFIFVELHKRAPLFDLRVCKRPMVIAGGGAVSGIYISFMGILFLLPQLMVYVLGTSVFVSGLSILPLGIGMMVSAPLFAARWTAKVGMRWALVSGLSGMAIGALALVLACRPTASIWTALIPMFVVGFCCGLTVTPATTVIMSDVGIEKAGDGSAVNQLGRQIGGALGVAIVGSVLAAVYAAGVTPAIDVLPPGERAAASKSIEAALDAAAQLPPAQGVVLDSAARASFESGARIGFILCGLVLVAFALLALMMVKPQRSASTS